MSEHNKLHATPLDKLPLHVVAQLLHGSTKQMYEVIADAQHAGNNELAAFVLGLAAGQFLQHPLKTSSDPEQTNFHPSVHYTYGQYKGVLQQFVPYMVPPDPEVCDQEQLGPEIDTRSTEV